MPKFARKGGFTLIELLLIMAMCFMLLVAGFIVHAQWKTSRVVSEMVAGAIQDLNGRVNLVVSSSGSAPAANVCASLIRKAMVGGNHVTVDGLVPVPQFARRGGMSYLPYCRQSMSGKEQVTISYWPLNPPKL